MTNRRPQQEFFCSGRRGAAVSRPTQDNLSVTGGELPCVKIIHVEREPGSARISG